MMSSSADFLAPSSWPACSCLTSWQGSSYRRTLSQLRQQLSSALQTTSLARLHVATTDTDTFNLLSNVSNLCGLTSLTIDAFNLTSAPLPPPVLAAIASLTNLQVLDTSTSYSEDAPSTDLSPSWSQLQQLTRLHLTTNSVDLRQVSVLPALQALQLGVATKPAGSLASLFPLTCLTALTCGAYEAAEDEPAVPEASSISSEQVVVPVAWRMGMRSLEWSCRDSFCIPVVAHLTGLVDLELMDVTLTPGLVRAFAKLPHLERLTLWDASAPAPSACPSIPRQLLPTLPSPNFTLNLETENLGALHMFARWTNIQRPITLLIGCDPDEASEEGRGAAEYLSLKGCGARWLVSLWRTSDSNTVTVVLADDEDVDTFLTALRDSVGVSCAAPLWLGKAVTPAAFCRLLSCKHLPGDALTIAKPPEAMKPYVVGWTGALALTTAHLTELLQHGPAPSLNRLCIDESQQLEDVGVAALASVAYELRVVTLWGATKVGDAGLAALALGCPKLHSVELREAGRVTAGGLRLLLTVARSLQVVCMQGLGAASARQVAAELAPMIRADRWGPLAHWTLTLVAGMVQLKRRW